MAVIQCKEHTADRRGPIIQGGDINSRTYRRKFQVITDDNLTGGLEVLINGTGIPKLGDIYDTRPQGGSEWDNGAGRVGYDTFIPDQDQPRVWFVLVDYSSVVTDQCAIAAGGPDISGGGAGGQAAATSGGGGVNENPLSQPAIWSYSPLQSRKTIYRALGRTNPFFPFDFLPGETPFINQAKQGYDPLPEIDDHGLQLTVTRNEVAFDQAAAMGSFFDRLNDVAWKGWPPLWVKCDYITATDKFTNKLKYVEASYHFSIKQTWDWEPINQGSYYLNVDDKKVTPDISGRSVFPVRLNVNGGQLADDADPITLHFRVYRTQDFSLLGL